MSVLATRPARVRALVAATGLVSCLVLTACGSEGPPAQADDHTAAGFPVTVKNCGRDVTIDAPPERAVSLNQGSTEILLSLGLADRMVGTATWTDPVLDSLATANASVPRLADQAPSYERLLDADPDFVTASFASTFGDGGVTTPEALSKLGVGAYLSPAECLKDNEGDGDGQRGSALQIDAIFQEITELSQIFGVPARGAELVADLERRMAAAEAGAKGAGVSVMYWFANAESPYIAGCCGGPGIISRALDVENAFDDTTEEWPQVNWETVADRNPDVLVLGDLTRKSQTAETGAAKIAHLKKNPVTSRMDAVLNDRFVLLTGAELNPSIRTVYAMENLASQLADLGLTGPGSSK
ncbi:ABC transporter substrate-binding protein [Aeromicrobium chenweiae]|uniref:ABC transporter substrate-binding protein n=1 Tax=Aeromicrobium chenweiae TaxID=2079793 RepID=A0A2S0WLT9_9ACTN|nr:ABC transporter substrate-binding protein [Aeromicrobium chenweiae]AWB92308.1 ABC transporter substrate-binding protein [Aeromicrobium chenweiae]TGN31406.1 ABC transporter substrate-binding protein [Aeromicrobium chenweiae]